MKHSFLVLFSLCILSFGIALAQSPGSCETDDDCDDGLFCTAGDACVDGSCVAVSACPPFINGCIQGSFCDEENDQCVDILDDSYCAIDEFCAPSGDCLAFGQDVGSQFCGQVQTEAQDAVEWGAPYRNHGQMVKTAAHVVDLYSESGAISEECSSCIVSQFARRIPIEEQKPCGMGGTGGTVCPVDLLSLFPDPVDVDSAVLACEPVFFAIESSDTDGNDITLAAVYSSDTVCLTTPGPGLCYGQVIDGVGSPLVDTPLTPEEFSGCEEILRKYGLDLEAVGQLPSGSVAGCPLVDPLGGGN